MATITWHEDDKGDPYPAVIETLGKVLEFAGADSEHRGIVGDAELRIVQMMYTAARDVLAQEDPASLPLLGDGVM